MVFILSAFCGIRIRGLWKLPDGRDWLWGKLGLVLMCRAMLSKSWIQFSVDGQGCVPSLLLTWDQTMVEVMKIMVTSFKRSCACIASLSAPGSRPSLTHASTRDSWTLLASLGQSLVGPLLLSPGSWSAQILFLPSKSLSPHFCENSGGSVVGLMAVSSKRAYATPRSAAPRAPAPVAGHCWHIPPQDSLKHSKAGLAQSLWGLFMCTRFCLSHLSIYIYTSR